MALEGPREVLLSDPQRAHGLPPVAAAPLRLGGVAVALEAVGVPSADHHLGHGALRLGAQPRGEDREVPDASAEDREEGLVQRLREDRAGLRTADSACDGGVSDGRL